MTLDQDLRSRSGLLLLKPLALLIGVHYQTLYGWTREGHIPHVRVGTRIKFDPTKVADWLQARSIG